MPMLQTQAVTISDVRNNREEQLQFLRFLAFLNIYIYHCEQWLFFPYPASHCAFLAVSFFFMLSGLVTGYSLSQKQVRADVRSIGVYLWKKVKKLYPLYFCTVLAAMLLSGFPTLLAENGVQAMAGQLRQLLRSLLLLQAWFTEGFYDFNGVGWYLSCAMFLYALTLPAMAVLNRINKRRHGWFWLGCGGAGVLLAAAVYCYATQSWDMSYWHYIFPPARAGEYLAGMILGVVLCTVKPRLHFGEKYRILLTLLEAAALIYWFRSLSSPGNYWRNHIVSWLIPNMVLLSVFTVGGGWVSALFRRAPLVRLGNLSFSCYLIHQLILRLYQLSCPAGELSQGGKAASFVFCLAVSVVFAQYLDRKKA